MPFDLYNLVKDEIPKEIGVYVACKRQIVEGYKKYVFGFDELLCVKNAKSRLLQADKEVILSSMLRCACRDRARKTGIFSYDSLETEPESNFDTFDLC